MKLDRYSHLIFFQQGFYRETRGAIEGYIKFTSFFSRSCKADIYDSEGNIIKKDVDLFIDSLAIRRTYELVPEEQLPQVLRTQSSQLETSAQTSP
jgi:hypothetical protein